MAAYTIEVKEINPETKHFMRFIEDYAKHNSFISIERIPNEITKKAIEDGMNGKVFTAKSAKDLINSVK